MTVQCILCGTQPGEELTLDDYGVDRNSGALVCKNCYTSPADNVVSGPRSAQAHGQQIAAQQGIALKKMMDRQAAKAQRQGR